MLHVCTCRMSTTLTLLAKHRILTRPHSLLAHRLCPATSSLHQPVRNNHAAGGQNFRPERTEYANLVSKSLLPGEREEVKQRIFDRRRTSKGKDPSHPIASLRSPVLDVHSQPRNNLDHPPIYRPLNFPLRHSQLVPLGHPEHVPELPRPSPTLPLLSSGHRLPFKRRRKQPKHNLRRASKRRQ